ncbi:hypothetical protein SAMN02745164_01696 [Marinitoga hydrogenitolerans DSM 16785]|uniref:Uncharacterized protein n=1 Tax=Marinitoga hydrogenitolerans (strain DSM 16785 / JCM 12826 / AT1271) TaxID=1122195 RepID=A0A1M4YJH9_MARH1|nr:hypothetical protein [Marinitoga hydrogenitolerans]SHF05837.1 hypothetical protein SAMN02745164_01696 [Marinitoga hydrogenitolerans DSM 16785]
MNTQDLNVEYREFLKIKKKKRKVLYTLIFLTLFHIIIFISSIQNSNLGHSIRNFSMYIFVGISLISLFSKEIRSYWTINFKKFYDNFKDFSLILLIVATLSIKIFTNLFLKKTTNFDITIFVFLSLISFFYFVVLQEFLTNLFENKFVNCFVTSFLFALFSNTLFTGNYIPFYNYMIGVAFSLSEYFFVGYITHKTKNFYIPVILMLI